MTGDLFLAVAVGAVIGVSAHAYAPSARLPERLFLVALGVFFAYGVAALVAMFRVWGSL